MLEPRWQSPGSYDAYVIPVQPGDYVFRIYGSIDGDAVDETFIPGPETFSVVLDRTTLEFPQAAASADGLTFGALGGSDGVGSDDIGGGVLAGAIGILALFGGSRILRRRTALRRASLRAASAGD